MFARKKMPNMPFYVPNKPKIMLSGGEWKCFTGLFHGHGKTPLEAYVNWYAEFLKFESSKGMFGVNFLKGLI